ncbi:MAG: ThiF family adenylyltransferase, partial [Rickettsiales bacterium]|nr:ThiF family adenylyltransferase [Rickettsiales bacterium]
PEINVKIHKNKLEKHNILEILSNYDVIIDGSDNFETRFIVNDACLELGKPLISGAILRFEGQIACFRPYLTPKSPCYRCFYPDVPPEGTMPNCSTNGIIAPIAGIIGSMQALYAIKLITGNDDGLDGFVTIYDGKANQFRKVKLQKDENCVCGSR